MYLLREMSLMIVVSLFIIQKGSGQKAINCYRCEYPIEHGATDGAECNDPFDKSKFNTTRCEGSNPRCAKIKVSQGSAYMLGRECFENEGYCAAIKAMMEGKGFTVVCEECSDDGCNSGRRGALPAHQLVLLLIGLAASAPFFPPFK